MGLAVSWADKRWNIKLTAAVFALIPELYKMWVRPFMHLKKEAGASAQWIVPETDTVCDV